MTEAGRIGGAVVASLCVLLVASAPSTASAADRPGAWVLPPLDGSFIRGLVAPEDGLPPGVAFAGAQAEGERLVARYALDDGDSVVLAFIHPEAADEGDVVAGDFAVRVLESPPGEVADAVVEAVARHVSARRGEDVWRRTSLSARPPPAPVPPTDEAPRKADPRDTAATWTWIAGAWLILVLFGGLALNARRHPRPPRRPAAGRPRAAPVAILLVAGAAALRLWYLDSFPVTNDETSNLEPMFWRTWFLAWESRSSPPLFRFWIHLTAGTWESLWTIRLPMALAGTGVVWLLYRMLRERAGLGVGVAVAAVAALHPMLLHFSAVQKSYVVWVLLLLLAHRAWCRAAGGHPRSWVAYAGWTTLAALTHYLTPLYLAGHVVYAWLRRRDVVRDQALALAPAALALAPFLAPILLIDDPTLEPGAGYLSVAALSAILVWNGGAGLLLAGAATLLPRRDPAAAPGPAHPPGDGALPWMLALGSGATLLLVDRDASWRFFIPLFPLAALWLAPRIARAWRDDRRARVLLAVAALLVAVPKLSTPESDLYEDAVRLRAEGPGTPPEAVVVHPAQVARGVAFEVRGHREAPLDPGPVSLPDGRGRLIGSPGSESPQDVLDRVAAQEGGADVLVFDADPSEPWEAVLSERCARLGEHPGVRGWRCRTPPR